MSATTAVWVITPEMEAAKLYRQIVKTRNASVRADADLAHAASEAAELRAHLATLEAQYRAQGRAA